MIKILGVNVLLWEVEVVFLCYLGVCEVIVFGMFDEMKGEIVVVVIVLVDGYIFDVDQIIMYLK